MLYDFFTALPYWRMQPLAGVTGDAVALADAGQTYVIYLPHGGATTLDLTGAPGSFAARWFNPRTGEFGEPFRVRGEGEQKLEAPGAEDWTVHLQRNS
jgi:hypothetical protein